MNDYTGYAEKPNKRRDTYVKYKPNQCPDCTYLTDTIRIGVTKPANACGWDCQVFNGETKKKCVRYEKRTK